MSARDPKMLPHGATAVRVRNGWIGQFTIPPRTCHVRDDAGLVRVFGSAEAAERAALKAMVRALNAPAPAVAGKPRAIVRNSRWARADAELGWG